MSLMETPEPTNRNWSSLVVDTMIREHLRRAGVYQAAANAGWPVGIHLHYDDPKFSCRMSAVSVTIGSAPDLVVPVARLERDYTRNFKKDIQMMAEQVEKQLKLMI